MNKELTYGYDTDGLTHQPRVIFDGKSRLPYDLYWDANGNLAQVIQCDYNEVRFHEWDDNNRLRAVISPNQVGFYGYDGNGDRVWKLTGSCQIDNQNGGEMSYSTLLDDAVLYPNPYLTITPTGYTKHYYIGSERIATAIGEGGWGNALVNKDQHDAEISTAFFKRYENDLPCEQYTQTINYDIAGEYREEIQYNCNPKCLRNLKLNYAYDYLAKCINTYSKTLNQEKTFFTHSDHLGSASWITYSSGYPVQYIHYAPYGELMANQKTSSFDERYKFTGKERDAESGYYYHGARFLLSDAGIWLSVDPLADKYIYATPYMYCAGNPIKYVDPDGTEHIWKIASLMQIQKNRNLTIEQKNSLIKSTKLIENGMRRSALDVENVFELFAHGTSKSVLNKFTSIKNPNELYQLFTNNSKYLDSKNSKSSIYILYACNTGAGENSIAQQFSEIDDVFGSVVIAPTGTVSIDKNGREYVTENGEWNVFYKGEKISTISGSKSEMTKYVQEKLLNLSGYLKQCEQQYKDLDK